MFKNYVFKNMFIFQRQDDKRGQEKVCLCSGTFWKMLIEFKASEKVIVKYQWQQPILKNRWVLNRKQRCMEIMVGTGQVSFVKLKTKAKGVGGWINIWWSLDSKPWRGCSGDWKKTSQFSSDVWAWMQSSSQSQWGEVSCSEHQKTEIVVSDVQVPALSVEVYLRSRGSSRRQSHPGIPITSHHIPIPLHYIPIPSSYILIQSRHSPLPWQLTDRVSQQIGTWWDGFANSSIILIFARQSELVLCRSVWECHQIWP